MELQYQFSVVFCTLSAWLGDLGIPDNQVGCISWLRPMADVELTDEEWAVFLSLAERLDIDVAKLGGGDSTFTDLESAGHRMGRAVAQCTTERLCAKKTAKALSKLHACPDCGRRRKAELKDRSYVTTDGPIQLHEVACYCSTCRRDFFPAAD